MPRTRSSSSDRDAAGMCKRSVLRADDQLEALARQRAVLRAMADRVEARLRVARMVAPPGGQRERAREAAAVARMTIEAIARGSLGYAFITARV